MTRSTAKQAEIARLSQSSNTLTVDQEQHRRAEGTSKFASKINNLTGGLQALDDARRADDQAERVLQILEDPLGDATSLMIKGIEEQQAIIAENLSEVAEAVGRGTEALLLGAQLSLLGATLPMRADQLTAGQQAQIQDRPGKYQSAHSRSNAAAGGGVVQDELEAAVTAANKLKEIIIPPAENRVFYKLQMPDGSTVRGSVVWRGSIPLRLRAGFGDGHGLRGRSHQRQLRHRHLYPPGAEHAGAQYGHVQPSADHALPHGRGRCQRQRSRRQHR